MKLHQDVLEEYEKKIRNIKDKKELNKIETQELKEVMNSIGFYQPTYEYQIKCDEKGKSWQGAEKFKELVWNVNTDMEGVFTTENQEIAEILSLLYQINVRLKRVENSIKNKLWRE